MKYRYFWISVIILLVSSRTYNIDRFINDPISPLTKLSILGMVLSFLFIIYFILEETGIIEYLRERL